MAIGNNVKAYLGIQADKDTLATEIIELLPTSASMENAVDSIESEAFTGNRFTDDGAITSIYPDGDFEIELTPDQIPAFLLVSGFYETSQAPATQDLAADIAIDDTTFEPVGLGGMVEGTSVTVADGTNTETVTISSIDKKTGIVTVDTAFINAYTTIDGTTITSDSIYDHVFKVSNTLDTWGTGLIDYTDETMYKEYRGIKGDSLSFSAQQKSYISASMSAMGLEGTRVDGSSVPTDYSTINNITEERLLSFDTSVAVNSGDITGVVDDIELNLNNNLDGDDYAINSRIRRDLIATASDADVTITTQFNKVDYLNYKSQLEEGTDISLDYNLAPYLDIELPKVMLTEVAAPADTQDKITISMSGNVYNDTAQGSPMIFHIYNSVTTDHKTDLTDGTI